MRIVDYQVPLNARQGDGLGKVDLLGVDAAGRICVIELPRDRAEAFPQAGDVGVISLFRRIQDDMRPRRFDGHAWKLGRDG